MEGEGEGSDVDEEGRLLGQLSDGGASSKVGLQNSVKEAARVLVYPPRYSCISLTQVR